METANQISVWELCLEGGWIMIPLALLALISIYILIERSIVIYRASKLDDSFMKRISDHIHEGEIEPPCAFAKTLNRPTPDLSSKA